MDIIFANLPPPDSAAIVPLQVNFTLRSSNSVIVDKLINLA